METGIPWNELDGPSLQKKLEEYCATEGISDIHFAPERDDVRLEVRLHGVLEEISRLNHKIYQDLVRQIKFLSKLKLNLTNIPQDGHYTFVHEDRRVNVRVATLP